MKKRLERPRSPDKPEYNFNFTVDVLTDGKVVNFFKLEGALKPTILLAGLKAQAGRLKIYLS